MITLTEKAAKRVRHVINLEELDGYGLRIRLLPGGCSGYQYDFALESRPQKGDHVIKRRGVKIFVDPKTLKLIKGIRLDYAVGINNAGFRIENSKILTCGCGLEF